MRKLLVIVIVCFAAFTMQSQKYGNEWIDFSKQYFKFPVINESIYRIDSATLSRYFDLSTINPKNFQLFIKGKEQFLFIKGESDNQVNKGDYIEFYAKSEAGEMDSTLYIDAKYLPNPYVTLFNDTVYAFLTLNNTLTNKRYIQETDINAAPHPAANYFYAEKVHYNYNSYNSAADYQDGVCDPNYTQAESRAEELGNGSTMTTNFSPLNSYTSAPQLPFYVTVCYAGKDYSPQYPFGDHQIQTYYTDNNNAQVLLHDTMLVGCKPVKKTFIVNPQNTDNNTNISLTSVNISTLTAYIGINYVQAFYPHNLDLHYKTSFGVYADDALFGTKNVYNFTNFNPGVSDSVLFYDLTNGRRIRTVSSGNAVTVVVPNQGGRKKCFIIGDSAVINITAMHKVGQNGYFTDYSLLEANKTYVLLYNKLFKSSATNYALYRRSVEGGSYNVISVDVDDLYEQFSFGINKHPAALRNFFKLLNDKHRPVPKYIFMVGHGIRCAELNPAYQSQNLIPTMGVPSCDNLFTAGLSDGSKNYYWPEIPIGRISALSNTEVEDYLDKVKTHEATNRVQEQYASNDWKKRMLHFAGGDNESLIKTIDQYLKDYATIVGDTLFGARVSTYRKNTSAPIQTSISDSIYESIKYGCSVMTFFGHGGEAEFDMAIDDPGKYNNTGKYPFFIANSCNSGDVFIPTRRSVSERFVFAPKRGSIGFVATTTYGQDYYLYLYTRALYKSMAVTNYGMGLGDMVKEAAYQSSQGEPFLKFVGLDMTFHGDPSLIISPGSKPDYQLKAEDVTFDLKSHSDSIGIKFIITNRAKAVADSFGYKITRYFPEGDSVNIIHKVRATRSSDTISFNTPIDFKKGFGLNNFSIKVDYLNKINEIDESNNTLASLNLFVPGGDLLPVYPYKYAIVPKTSRITLKASTSDPFSPVYSYRFQLDTCDKFEQPIRSAVITSKGGVIEWDVELPLPDSTVYFWRVSRDSAADNNFFNWRESSFQTVGTKRGWAQAHFHQFKNDAYRYIDYKKQERKFSFNSSTHIVECNNAVYPNTFWQLINASFDGSKLGDFGCAINGWNFIIFDSISGLPQTAIMQTPGASDGPGLYGNYVCHNGYSFHSFGPLNPVGLPPNPNWKADMESFLSNIPVNNYVLAFGTYFGGPTSSFLQTATYSNSLYEAFESIGAKKIRHIPDSLPYIMFGKKTTGKSLAGLKNIVSQEVLGKYNKQRIYLKDSIKTRWKEGWIASEIIGPSFKWNSLHWRVKNTDALPGDTSFLKLIGIKADGRQDTIPMVFKQDSSDVYDLGRYVNAAIYPQLKLVVFMADHVNTTPPQLKRLQVLYDEIPECAINPLKGFASVNDTLQEGDAVTFRFPIENIGQRNFDDSLVVTYWIEDAKHGKQVLPTRMKPRPFVPGKVIIDTVQINTYQLRGSNALWLSVNPLQHARYQKEQYQFNNIGRYPFKVSSDITNPLLDVTFDGVRILNGDIVSAKPSIMISLKDENRFLALNDTGAFTIKLQAPNQSSAVPIYFAQGLQFTPASLPKNSASILYNPNFVTDGRYTLMVQARDRSSNRSAANDFVIQFEVNNKPTVTSVLNYPNPFTTSTRFVFTLTGSEVPEVFTIQIMTITGKIVREITRAELGFLHIGRNITEFSWDGTDAYHDRLANGVYLYRIVTKLNGQDVEKNSSGADKFFKKEFGKMVIMR